MKAFAANLRVLAGEAEGMRPLLCDGNPLTCEVAIVGANPGTTTPFWKFWSEQGMDRSGWIAAYRVEHDGKFNRSRAAIERLVPQVVARIIELNAFAAQSKRIANLERSRRTTEVFTFVLDAVRPRVIVCAGAHASRAVQAISLSWRPVLLETTHFIYWGKESERLLAAQIQQSLKRPSPRRTRAAAIRD